MSGNLELRASDRVLVIAPHPDDESIAAGGLLQVARVAGAATRLVVLTDGDNNPWPQRWLEKRWCIDPAARARWGARRREEARAATRILGMAERDVHFLGLPDLGLTDLLMRGDESLLATLARTLAEFVPTLLAVPSLADRHPDHSAAHILMRIAMQRCGIAPRLLTFAVHGGLPEGAQVAVALDAQQRGIKQAAILAHATQMQFSRRRFLRFAADREIYAASGTPNAAHPLSADIADGKLHVRVDGARCGPLRGQVLFVALEGALPLRRIVELDMTQAQRRDGAAEVDLALPQTAWQQGFVKLSRREPGWRVFDRFGWQSVS